MTYQYCFYNSEVNPTDLQRICDENEGLSEVLLVRSDNEPQELAVDALLLIKESFLAQFRREDKVRVAGQFLDLTWGCPIAYLEPEDIGPPDEGIVVELKGWRCGWVLNRPWRLRDMQDAINSAREHLASRTKIEVHYL